MTQPHGLFHARSRARRLAMQAVYQWETTGQDPNLIIEQFAGDEGYEKADVDYFRELVNAATAGKVDDAVRDCMDRPMENVGLIECAIIRNAAYEIIRRADVPAAVAITEAVHLAKKFGAEEGYRFVNGALDRLAKECAASTGVSPDTDSGEDALIRRHFLRPVRAGVALGIGDDAAVLNAIEDQLVVAMDTMVVGSHFAADADAGDVGYKALAVNLSDLAAMGALPRWATLALTLPENDESWIGAFAKGFFTLADEHDVGLIGGDTTRGPLTITVQLLGVLDGGPCLRRSGAQPGHGIYMTGNAGDVAVAARCADRLCSLDDASAEVCRARLVRPRPRIAEGRVIARYASAAMDISDGLFKDLQRVLVASGVGAVVELDRVPVSSAFEHCCKDVQEHLSLLTYGEDYELLFTMDDGLCEELGKALGDRSAPFTRIGMVEKGKILRCTRQGCAVALPQPLGFDHFNPVA